MEPDVVEYFVLLASKDLVGGMDGFVGLAAPCLRWDRPEIHRKLHTCDEELVILGHASSAR